jgi:hypothetical protein
MALTWHGYFEQIDTFTFREKAALSISKRVRELAYSLQVDIEIVSTDGNDYRNKKSSPEYGFYGYAVLVMRDFAEIEIPIHQPRQTLYFERIESAYTNWYNLYLALGWREGSKGLADVIGQIGQAVGLGNYTVLPASCPSWSGFEEVRIRELFVKCRYGTQFKIEVSRWEPVIVTGEIDCNYDGKSQRTDGDKDSGLPPYGVQPQKSNDSANPYSGFPEPSTPQEQSDYFNNGQNSLDNPNVDNAPIPPYTSQSCHLAITTNYGGGNVVVHEYFNIIIPLEDFPIIEERNINDPPYTKAFFVKLRDAGTYFNGSTFQSAERLWSHSATTLAGECILV